MMKISRAMQEWCDQQDKLQPDWEGMNYYRIGKNIYKSMQQ